MANMYPIWSPRDGAELRSLADEFPVEVGQSPVDADGRLLLFRGYGDPLAIFRAHGWAYVVVTTPERGPDGKFVKRGRR